MLLLNRRKHPELMPYVGVVLAGVQIFFLILNNADVASPFGRDQHSGRREPLRRRRTWSLSRMAAG